MTSTLVLAAKSSKTCYLDGTANIDTIDADAATIDSLTITSGTAITSIDTDISSVSGSDDTLASAKAIKTYVDAQVTAQDLDFQATPVEHYLSTLTARVSRLLVARTLILLVQVILLLLILIAP